MSELFRICYVQHAHVGMFTCFVVSALHDLYALHFSALFVVRSDALFRAIDVVPCSVLPLPCLPGSRAKTCR